MKCVKAGHARVREHVRNRVCSYLGMTANGYPNMFFSSIRSQEQNVQPAIQLIRDLGSSPSLLVHVQSNGGAAQMTMIAEMLARDQPAAKPAIPAKAIVCACTASEWRNVHR